MHRGIEFDKALAIMFLTKRGIGGIPEYDKNNIWVSFADFEKIENESEDLENLPTIKLLTDIMTNRSKPAYFNLQRGLISLEKDPYQYTKDTMVVRQMTAFAAGISLQTDYLDATDNYARLFYINNSINEDPPEGTDVITALGETTTDPTSAKYWTTAYGKSAKRIIHVAKNARDLYDNEEKLMLLIRDIFNMDFSVRYDRLDEKTMKVHRALLAQREMALTDILEKMSIKGMNDPRRIVQEMYNLYNRARQIYIIEDDYLKETITTDQFFDLMIRERAFSKSLAKKNPILTIAAKSLASADIPSDIVSRINFITDSAELKRNFYYAFGNIQILRKLKVMMTEER